MASTACFLTLRLPSSSSHPSSPSRRRFHVFSSFASYPTTGVGFSGRFAEPSDGITIVVRRQRCCYRSVGKEYDFGVGGSDGDLSFDQAVFLFNTGDYYDCHDVLEAIWNDAEEPVRTIVHGILQCAIGFHHLFNQNHRGAMMELGEGLCKLRKMNFTHGPFYQFEREIAAVQDFIHKTQIELAACADDYCLTMDGSKRYYQLLGSFAAGQKVYALESSIDGIFYISFHPKVLHDSEPP